MLTWKDRLGKTKVEEMDNNNFNHDPTAKPNPGLESPLRRQAQAKLQAMEELQTDLLDPKQARRLVHELRVHQLELEIQNEELRVIQQELEAAKSRFKDLYDFAPVGYMTVSEAGMMVETNRTAATLLSVEQDTLAGQPFSRFILPEDQDIYYHHRAAIFETAEPQTCKLRLLRTDHPPFWARLETAPAREGEQDPPLCRIMLSDISEGVRLAAEKKQLEAEYRQLQKEESLGRMAGAIAHHFNNLLGVVMGNLELAAGTLPDETGPRENIDSAMKAARRAAEVSSSMLTYLGQTLGKHELLDLSSTCHTSLQKLRTVMPKEVEMVVDFPPDGPLIKANAYQIQQVLKNLITNAWEGHNHRPGTIQLSIKKVVLEDIPATHRFPLDWQAQQNLFACLTIKDSGCGINVPDIEKLFDPFFTSKFLGRGLGLSIVLGIIRAHGGVVTVTSKVDRGSVFNIFLPIYAGEIVRPTNRAAIGQEASEGTVLVVEDEPMLRDIVKAALTRMGYMVLVAKNGFEALEIFQQHRESIGCVLCDLIMPGMDGWDTLSALRRLSPDLPVILSSGYDPVQAMAGDHPDLPQFFLGKPYDLSALDEVVRQAFAENGKK